MIEKMIVMVYLRKKRLMMMEMEQGKMNKKEKKKEKVWIREKAHQKRMK